MAPFSLLSYSGFHLVKEVDSRRYEYNTDDSICPTGTVPPDSLDQELDVVGCKEPVPIQQRSQQRYGTCQQEYGLYNIVEYHGITSPEVSSLVPSAPSRHHRG